MPTSRGRCWRASSKAGVKRLVIVGGASSLEVAPGVRLFDTPEFQDEWRPEAASGIESLDVYRSSDSDVAWTYVSPGALLAPGERTGSTAPAASSCW